METRPDCFAIKQSNMNVHAIWGTLAGAFAIALWLGHKGAETDAGRLAVDLFAGGIVVISVAFWVWFLVHPAELHVSPELITLLHRKSKGSTDLRPTGELYLHRVRVGAKGGTQTYLRVTGSDEMIPLVFFDWKKVREACLATGWRFVEGR